jgi:hypothetical protein
MRTPAKKWTVATFTGTRINIKTTAIDAKTIYAKIKADGIKDGDAWYPVSAVLYIKEGWFE